jgi:hypothetical protein
MAVLQITSMFVGSDLMGNIGYKRAKVVQKQAIEAGGTPTPSSGRHSFSNSSAAWLTPALRVKPFASRNVLMQPIAADDIAASVVGSNGQFRCLGITLKAAGTDQHTATHVVDNNALIGHFPMQKVALRPEPMVTLVSARAVVSGDSPRTRYCLVAKGSMEI